MWKFRIYGTLGHGTRGVDVRPPWMRSEFDTDSFLKTYWKTILYVNGEGKHPMETWKHLLFWCIGNVYSQESSKIILRIYRKSFKQLFHTMFHWIIDDYLSYCQIFLVTCKNLYMHNEQKYVNRTDLCLLFKLTKTNKEYSRIINESEMTFSSLNFKNSFDIGT